MYTSAYGFSASIAKSGPAVVAAYRAAADSWPTLPIDVQCGAFNVSIDLNVPQS